MKKLVSTLCAGAVAASFSIGGVLPANAAPAYVLKAPTAETSDVVLANHQKWKRKNFRRGTWNGSKNGWQGPKYGGSNYGWYNGYKAYRYPRRGYRYHNGWWLPPAAFVTGAIIGGAIANSGPRYYAGGDAHVQWCYDHYRSYRAYDNTFQPYRGPRKQCISPYL